MDRLAEALGMDPAELRLVNALKPNDQIITGQRITGTAPVAEVIRACASHPSAAAEPDHPMALPGGAGRTADPSHVIRGEALAVGIKNLMFSEGFDDFSTASCRLVDGVATITCACAEVGQGFVTLVHQIAREVLGVEEVVLAVPSTDAIDSAGSTSASRQTWMSGGAVQAACEAVRLRLLERVADRYEVPVDDLVLVDGRVVALSATFEVDLAEGKAKVQGGEALRDESIVEVLDEEGYDVTGIVRG